MGPESIPTLPAHGTLPGAGRNSGWAREQYSRHRVQALQWSRKLFVQTATNWLHFLGRLEEPLPKIVPFADRLADFAAYQREERGLSPATISGQGWQVAYFSKPAARLLR
jgi:integrase/recombinase XerD